MSFPRPPIPTRSPRPVLPSLAALGLALAVVALLSACGGGGGGGEPVTPPPVQNQATVSTARSGELLGYVRQRLQARGPQGAAATEAHAPTWFMTSVSTSGLVSRSGTVVQEPGVDEEDLLKTDGTRLYALQPLMSTGQPGSAYARLDIHARDAAGRPQPLGQAMLSSADGAWMTTRGLLLADDLPRLAVVAEGSSGGFGSPCPPGAACLAALLPYVPQRPRLHVHLLDASQPAALPAPERLEIDGRLVGTRQIGRLLYVVASHVPQLAFDQLPATATTAERQAALDRLTVADVLPMVRVNGGAAQPLVTEVDCWLQPANASAQVAITTITTIDLGSPTWARSSRCFVGGTETLYLSASNLYLATTRDQVTILADGRTAFAPEMRTDLHKFALAGAGVSYRASGSVAGHMGWDRERRSHRLSEHNGDLRVLGFTGTLGWLSAADAGRTSPSPATLTVLREGANATLQTVATLPNVQRPAPIGKPGEQVYAVRFAGDRGYVVTFRQVDPLYVLDLSNPADPRTAGELELPGFSDWLYPLEGGLLFGVGKDANDRGEVQGVKVALFDVRDAARPTLLDSRAYGGRGSMTALDTSAHGLSLRAAGGLTRLALPALLTTADGSGPPEQQLLRFQVDGGTRTLATPAAIGLGSGWVDLSATRSLLLGNQVHLLMDGRLQTWDW